MPLVNGLRTGPEAGRQSGGSRGIEALQTCLLPPETRAASCRSRPIGVFPPLSVMLDLAAFTRLVVRKAGRTSGRRSCARVAERQTRWLQVPVSERAWGFKSPLAHAFDESSHPLRMSRVIVDTPVFGPGCFYLSGLVVPGGVDGEFADETAPWNPKGRATGEGCPAWGSDYSGGGGGFSCGLCSFPCSCPRFRPSAVNPSVAAGA